MSSESFNNRYSKLSEDPPANASTTRRDGGVYVTTSKLNEAPDPQTARECRLPIIRSQRILTVRNLLRR